MKKKSNRFFLPIFLIVSMLISGLMLAPEVVRASADTTVENWESYTVGTQNGTGTYGTFAEAGGGAQTCVTNTWSHGGTMSYRRIANSNLDYWTWYNFTSSITTSAESVTIYFYISHNIGNSPQVIYEYFFLYNDSYQVNEMIFYSDGTSTNTRTDIAVYDIDSTGYTLELDANCYVGVERRLTITHTTLNLYNYSWYYGSNDTYINGVTISGRNSGAHNGWTQLRTRTQCGNIITGSFTHTDDIIFSTTGGGGGSSESGDTTGYKSKCSDILARSVTYSEADKYIEQKYNSKINGIIQTIDLYVSLSQWIAYEYDNTAIELYACGENLGVPDTTLFGGSGLRILRWSNANVIVSNDYPVFEFYGKVWDSVLNPFDYNFWKNGHFVNLLSGDIRFRARSHSTDGYYADGEYCGTIIGNYINGDFSIVLDMCFYYSDTELVDPYEQISYAVETDKTTYTTCSEIKVTWASPQPYSCVLLYKDDTQINEYGFPRCISNKIGTMTFPAVESGNYSIKLKYNSVVRDITYFNITGVTCNLALWSDPNPSKIGFGYDIFYRYNKTNDGGIFYSTSDNDNYPTFSTIINANGGNVVTGKIHMGAPQNFEGNGYIYFWLAEKINNTYYKLLQHNHFITTFSEVSRLHLYYGDRWLYDSSSLELNSYMSNNIGITIEGSHPFVGGNVWIKCNNQSLRSVGGLPTFEFTEYDFFTSPQEYNITLELIIDNTSYVLAYETFIMVSDDTISENSVDNLILIVLPDPIMRAIVGIIILLGITFSPFIISLKMKQKNVTINVPNLAYAVAFVCGIAIITVVGFIGWEYMFFTAFVTISALIGLYLSGKRSTSTSGE